MSAAMKMGIGRYLLARGVAELGGFGQAPTLLPRIQQEIDFLNRQISAVSRSGWPAAGRTAHINALAGEQNRFRSMSLQEQTAYVESHKGVPLLTSKTMEPLKESKGKGRKDPTIEAGVKAMQAQSVIDEVRSGDWARRYMAPAAPVPPVFFMDVFFLLPEDVLAVLYKTSDALKSSIDTWQKQVAAGAKTVATIKAFQSALTTVFVASLPVVASAAVSALIPPAVAPPAAAPEPAPEPAPVGPVEVAPAPVGMQPTVQPWMAEAKRTDWTTWVMVGSGALALVLVGVLALRK